MMPAWKQFGLMIGIVSKRDDAECGLGRVKVTYPTLGDIESDWARVLAPYGGSGHGFQSIPEVGDEVVVAFMEGDPKIPLIVGSVYSMKNKPPSEKVDERIFKSRKGHTVVVSDQAGEERIELKTASGQHVTIDEGSKAITIKANGSVTIQAAGSVDVKGTSVVVTAGDVKLGGSAAIQPAVHGTILQSMLTTLVTALSTHIHPIVPIVGPSLPSPQLAALAVTLAPQQASLLSPNVKVT
ncbi:phage baseplate assembly protein V [Sorangium sp. So ce117]|uniref:phage baseplate assembly protein V n=1 Tax=Sorangium sp. So ce117 TaxID=3133277 RepID=UPI003F635C0C